MNNRGEDQDSASYTIMCVGDVTKLFRGRHKGGCFRSRQQFIEEDTWNARHVD
jgi:hypothetical protein